MTSTGQGKYRLVPVMIHSGSRRRLALLAVLVAGLVVHLFGTALHDSSPRESWSAGAAPAAAQHGVPAVEHGAVPIAGSEHTGGAVTLGAAAGEHQDGACASILRLSGGAIGPALDCVASVWQPASGQPAVSLVEARAAGDWVAVGPVTDPRRSPGLQRV